MPKMQGNDNGVIRTFNKIQANDNGIIRTLNIVQANDKGVIRTIFESGTTLSDKNIGDIVKITIDNVVWDFIVIQKGKPTPSQYQSTVNYDDSFNNGVWVMIKTLYSQIQGNSVNINDYANSDMHNWLNNNFYNLISQNIRNQIKQVKIPYGTGGGTPNVNSGANGLLCKVFLLSACELNWSPTYSGVTADGNTAEYFNNTSVMPSMAEVKRVARDINGYLRSWRTRSPRPSDNTQMFYAGIDGALFVTHITQEIHIRPTFILPETIKVDDNGFVTA